MAHWKVTVHESEEWIQWWNTSSETFTDNSIDALWRDHARNVKDFDVQILAILHGG